MRNMLLITATICAMLISNITFAFINRNSNLYIGLQAAYADLGYTNKWFHKEIAPSSTVENIDDTGLAGRAFVGYQFNRHASIEFGYTYLPHIVLKRINDSSLIKDLFQQVFDLTAKGTFPLKNKFSLFGKTGIAWVYRREIKSSIYNRLNISHVVPTLGFGIAYDISNNVSTDISYSRLFPQDDLKGTNFYAIGISYLLDL